MDVKNEDVNNIFKFSNDPALQFNTSKTQLILFEIEKQRQYVIDATCVKQYDTKVLILILVKNLGIINDSDMRFA